MCYNTKETTKTNNIFMSNINLMWRMMFLKASCHCWVLIGLLKKNKWINQWINLDFLGTSSRQTMVYWSAQPPPTLHCHINIREWKALSSHIRRDIFPHLALLINKQKKKKQGKHMHHIVHKCVWYFISQYSRLPGEKILLALFSYNSFYIAWDPIPAQQWEIPYQPPAPPQGR